eukprot:gene9739-7614_t
MLYLLAQQMQHDPSLQQLQLQQLQQQAAQQHQFQILQQHLMQQQQIQQFLLSQAKELDILSEEEQENDVDEIEVAEALFDLANMFQPGNVADKDSDGGSSHSAGMKPSSLGKRRKGTEDKDSADGGWKGARVSGSSARRLRTRGGRSPAVPRQNVRDGRSGSRWGSRSREEDVQEEEQELRDSGDEWEDAKEGAGYSNLPQGGQTKGPKSGGRVPGSSGSGSQEGLEEAKEGRPRSISGNQRQRGEIPPELDPNNMASWDVKEEAIGNLLASAAGAGPALDQVTGLPTTSASDAERIFQHLAGSGGSGGALQNLLASNLGGASSAASMGLPSQIGSGNAQSQLQALAASWPLLSPALAAHLEGLMGGPVAAQRILMAAAGKGPSKGIDQSVGEAVAAALASATSLHPGQHGPSPGAPKTEACGPVAVSTFQQGRLVQGDLNGLAAANGSGPQLGTPGAGKIKRCALHVYIAHMILDHQQPPQREQIRHETRGATPDLKAEPLAGNHVGREGTSEGEVAADRAARRGAGQASVGVEGALGTKSSGKSAVEQEEGTSDSPREGEKAASAYQQQQALLQALSTAMGDPANFLSLKGAGGHNLPHALQQQLLAAAAAASASGHNGGQGNSSSPAPNLKHMQGSVPQGAAANGLGNGMRLPMQFNPGGVSSSAMAQYSTLFSQGGMMNGGHMNGSLLPMGAGASLPHGMTNRQVLSAIEGMRANGQQNSFSYNNILQSHQQAHQMGRGQGHPMYESGLMQQAQAGSQDWAPTLEDLRRQILMQGLLGSDPRLGGAEAAAAAAAVANGQPYSSASPRDAGLASLVASVSSQQQQRQRR